MLEAHEFTVGALEDAKPLTLALPLDSGYGVPFLVGSSEEEAVAVFLSGEHRYNAFKTAGNGSRDGLLIPDVRIEVDEKSAFEPSNQATMLGAVICEGSGLVLKARGEGWRPVKWPITLVKGAGMAARTSVGFSKWNVVLGVGSEKRILFEVSAGKLSPADSE